MTSYTTSYSDLKLLSDNYTFIKECKCFITGQGLYNTYEIILFGTGQNRYTFNLTYNNKSYTFITTDVMIKSWKIRYHNQDDSEGEYECLSFKANGVLDEYGIRRAIWDEDYLDIWIDGEMKSFSIDSITAYVPDNELVPVQRDTMWDSQDLRDVYRLVDTCNIYEDVDFDMLEFYDKEFIFEGEDKITYYIRPAQNKVTIDQEDKDVYSITGDYYIKRFDKEEELHTITFDYYLPTHEYYEVDGTSMYYKDKDKSVYLYGKASRPTIRYT